MSDDGYAVAAARWQERNPTLDISDVPERCLFRGCDDRIMASGLIWTYDGRAWRMCMRHAVAFTAAGKGWDG